MNRTLAARLERIKRDNTSGARAITSEAYELVKDVAEREAGDLQQVAGSIRRTALGIMQAHPSMAPVIRMANDVLIELENAEDLGRLRHDILRLVKREFAESDRIEAKLAANAARTIRGATVLTYSHSSSVERALVLAAQSGKVSAVVAESRPVCEGKTLARNLAKAGIPVTYVVDMACFDLVDRVDLLLVGADCITDKEVVNKIGTSGLASYAHGLGRPVHVVASTDKFLPRSLAHLFAIAPRPAAEVARFATKGIEVRNVYYDRTPLKWVSSVITEQETLDARQVRSLCRSRPVARTLASARRSK